MDVLAAESKSKDPRVCLESTPTENIIAVCIKLFILFKLSAMFQMHGFSKNTKPF